MATWTPFPHAGDYRTTASTVKKQWARLHRGDAEPCPQDAAVLEAWALFHSGDFQRAAEAGLAAGNSGMTVANKATAIYATYLEPKEKKRLDLFMQVAERAEEQTRAEPDNANAWYTYAYALGRYSQGISVAKALAQGLGTKVKQSLEKCIELAPQHADAHIALGAFHAEVIDKVGSLIGGMTYGAKKETGLKLFKQALALNPGSAIAMIEYANALVMLEGDKRMKEATKLYEQAAACQPVDAMERLDVDLARAELVDD
jgi:tetratricopeptide (TPR) repeat protein